MNTEYLHDLSLRKFYLLFLFFFVGTIAFATPKFILIEICETADESIGTVKDYQHVFDWASWVADEADMEFIAYRFKKHELSENQIALLLSRINIGSDDTVLFYYSGHGFNLGTSEFPAFRIGNIQYTLDWVSQQLSLKTPRLQIVLYDACNIQLNEYQLTVTLPLVVSSSNKYKYRKLFAEASGSLKFTSNTAGLDNYSYGSRYDGSIFTNAFINTIDEVIREARIVENVAWSKIETQTISLTKEVARESNLEQTPYADNNIIEGSLPELRITPDYPIGKLENPD